MRYMVIGLALLGCVTRDENDGSGTPAMKVSEGRVAAVGPAPTINALAPYERLVKSFETCAFEGNQIVSTCPARAAFESQMRGVAPEIQIKVGEKMIAHPAPAVRVQAATMMRARGTLSPKSLDAITRVARAERDPRVLEAFIRIAGKQPGASNLLLAAASHPDSGVRLDAIAAIASVENRGMPGGAQKLVELAETDSDTRVRRAACEHAGRLGDDAVLPLYERTTATVTDPDFYASCMGGLAAMFHNSPGFDTTSEAAYRLFLRRLEATPRTQHSPPWTVMSTFCYSSHEADLDKLAAWKQKATWFDASNVKRVLASVIADRAASVEARSAAVESLAGLGATPGELVSLKKALVAPADKPLVDKIAAICE